MNSLTSFKAVVIYDEVTAGQRGMDAFRGCANALPTHINLLQPQLWRFDLLSDPGRFIHSLADASTANLLILSVTDSEPPPPLIRNWLDLWITGQHPVAVTLAVLTDDSEEHGDPDWLLVLQKSAMTARIDLITPLKVLSTVI